MRFAARCTLNVVVDSGVWISAFRFGGVPLQAIRTTLQKDHILMCDPIRTEVERILLREFGWAPDRTLALFSAYLQEATLVPIAGLVQNVCRDPKDNMVLECATVASAQVIVSGDLDLLTLNQFGSARIVTPRAYLTEKTYV